MKVQKQLTVYPAARTNGLNTFGDYDFLVHVMRRETDAPKLGDESTPDEREIESFLMISSVGGEPKKISKEEFTQNILDYARSTAATVCLQ